MSYPKSINFELTSFHTIPQGDRQRWQTKRNDKVKISCFRLIFGQTIISSWDLIFSKAVYLFNTTFYSLSPLFLTL